MIETSSGIGSSTFQLVRELTENITINLKVNTPETLFGLITFDNQARLEFNIMNHTDLSTLLPAINPGLIYYGGYGGFSANTRSVLSLLISGGVQGGSLQLRNEISKIAIVITDEADFSQSWSTVNLLHAANIYDVYAVGYGDTGLSDLKLIASDPSFVIYRSSIYYWSSHRRFQLLTENLIEQLCSSKQFYHVWLYRSCAT